MAMAFRTQPQQTHHRRSDAGWASDPSIDDPKKPRPFRPPRRSASMRRGPMASRFRKVADVPGWEEFENARTRWPALRILRSAIVQGWFVWNRVNPCGNSAALVTFL